MTTVYIEKPDENFSNDSCTDTRSSEICQYFSEVLKLFPMDCWVAGGSIVSMYLGQNINDIDIFFPGEREIFEAKNLLEAKGGKVIFESEFSIKVELTNESDPPVSQVFDLVKVMHTGPKQTIQAFDMICCMVSVNKDGWLYYADGFFNDLNNRIIHLNKGFKVISDEARILHRLTKYGRKGFELPLTEAEKWVKLLARAREESEKNKDNLAKKISGASSSSSTVSSSTVSGTNIFSYTPQRFWSNT